MKTIDDQHISNRRRWARAPRAPWVMLFGALLLLAGCATAPAQPTPPPPTTHNTKYRICFQQATGVPYNNNAPNINGDVLGDLGWTHAFRYVAENGSTVAEAAMQGIKDGNNLLLSFEVSKDVTFDAEDVIVLAIDPNGTSGNYRRLHITPFAAGTAGSASNIQIPAAQIKYWNAGNGTPGGWGAPAAAPPASLKAFVSRTAAGANSTWSVELTLSTADFGIPASNYFGLYFSVFKVNGSNFNYTESRWPPAATLSGPLSTDLEIGTPDQSQWGNATLGNAVCNGVYFGSSDISTNQSPPHVISLNKPNNFYVKVHNSTLDASGNAMDAHNIQATFKIANFGLPSLPQWQVIPVSGNVGTNPTALLPTITGNSFASIPTGSWTLTPAESADYAPPNQHQCILVELDLTDPDTLFINRSTWNNMEFQTTSSPFDETAVIGTEGYELPSGQDAHEFILREYRYNTEQEEKWESQIEGPKQTGDQQYEIQIAPRENARLATSITPPDIEIPSNFIDIKPGTGGPGQEMLRIPVKPDELITLIAEGSIQIRKELNDRLGDVGPNGVSLDEKFASERFLLPNNQAAYHAAGALVGSWDGFKENGFIIGQAMSLKVPPEMDTLFLAINDTEKGYEEHTGQGYQVQLVETPLKEIYTFASSLVGRDSRYEDITLPIGINLPTWILCGERRTGQMLTINKVQFERVEVVGCYGYILKSIGRK